jgi:hypothetical protein
LITSIVIILVFAFVAVEYNILRKQTSCDSNKCIQTKCGFSACVDGECKVIKTINGCCEDGVNCTQSSPTANYSFNSICSMEISTCQPQTNSASSGLFYNKLQESVIVFDGDVVFDVSDISIDNINAEQIEFNVSQLGLSNQTNFGITNEYGTVNITIKKVGEIEFMEFSERVANCSVGDGLINFNFFGEINNSPFEPTNGVSVRNFVTLSQNNGKDVLSLAKLMSDNITMLYYNSSTLVPNYTGICKLSSTFLTIIGI